MDFPPVNGQKSLPELEREILAYKSRLRALEKRGARRLKKDMRLDPAARFYRKGRMREEGD